jgi:hypothetical protein
MKHDAQLVRRCLSRTRGRRARIRSVETDALQHVLPAGIKRKESRLQMNRSGSLIRG